MAVAVGVMVESPFVGLLALNAAKSLIADRWKII